MHAHALMFESWMAKQAELMKCMTVTEAMQQIVWHRGQEIR